eukprot:SAG22_NODE_5830_length_946_cov_1.324675_1_plen_30_part_10
MSIDVDSPSILDSIRCGGLLLERNRHCIAL